MVQNTHTGTILQIIKWLLFGKTAVRTRRKIFYGRNKWLGGNVGYFYDIGDLSTLMYFRMIKGT